MTKKFRFMTGLLAVVLAFVMLSSLAYIAAESLSSASKRYMAAFVPVDQF